METEKRLIDANELLRYVGSRFGFMISKTELLRAIEMQPTVDATEVVQCQDCRHRHGKLCYMISGGPTPVGTGDNFSCAYGER